MKTLTLMEQTYLVAILSLGDVAYGVKIRERIIGLTGKSMVFGTLYNNLDQLVRKGYVVTEKGRDPSDSKKVYYRVTGAGKKALEEIKGIQDSLWAALPGNVISS